MKKHLLLFCTIITICICCTQKKELTSPEATSPTIAMCAPVITDHEWYESENAAPLFDGLDILDFPISTDDEQVQRYFDQGLLLAYGFNHAEAARSFHYATRLDSTCAMAYWGYAYVLGPNYNAGMEEDNYQRAYDAIQKAQKLSIDNATPKEKALIRALSERYVDTPPADRSALDLAFANAMAEVHLQYPKDADIATLYVEALMNLHPWDLWTADGTAKEWTPQIMEVFDQIFKIDPRHPGAHHFHIHAVEASAHPETGLKSAKLYDQGLVPNAGHLIHMPSHIYIRTGDYHLGTLANLRAVKADSSYLTACHAQGSYPLTLYPHNYHFMAATATLEGDSETALMAAEQVAAHANRQLMKEPGWGTIQHYYTIPYYVMVKFGKWDDILQRSPEDPELKYPKAVRHYARGMAYLGKGDLAAAKNELDELMIYANDEQLKEVTIWDVNNTHQLLQIASKVLKGEILATENQYAESIEILIEAIEIEDGLAYQEPPDWFFSVRHHLGDVQLRAGEYADAITTYQEDLRRLPKNGWALHGLISAQEKLQSPQHSHTEAILKKAWAYADVELSSSVIE